MNAITSSLICSPFQWSKQSYLELWYCVPIITQSSLCTFARIERITNLTKDIQRPIFGYGPFKFKTLIGGMVPVHALTHYLTGPLGYLISYTLYTPKNATWSLLLQRINDIGQNINWMHIWELMLIWTAIGQSWLHYSHVTWYDTCTKECNLMILWQKINPFGIKNWCCLGQNMDSNVSRPTNELQVYLVSL